MYGAFGTRMADATPHVDGIKVADVFNSADNQCGQSFQMYCSFQG